MFTLFNGPNSYSPMIKLITVFDFVMRIPITPLSQLFLTSQELEIMNLKRSHQQNLSDISQVNFSNVWFIKHFFCRHYLSFSQAWLIKRKCLIISLLKRSKYEIFLTFCSEILLASVIYYLIYLSTAFQYLTRIKHISVLLIPIFLDHTRTTESN